MELMHLVCLELLESAADYLDGYHMWVGRYVPGRVDREYSEGGLQDRGGTSAQTACGPESLRDGGIDACQEKRRRSAPRQVEQLLQLVMGQGYLLRAKADGWKLFCERRGFPAFPFVAGGPRYERLERALKKAEQVAFRPDGMVRFLNERRPKGRPPLTAPPVTAEGDARGLERRYLAMVARWRGQ
jgi:hypothetical protein